MAISYAQVDWRPDLGRMTTDITLDGSYGAGGYALDNASLGLLSAATDMNCTYTHATATSTNMAVYDAANNKLKVFEVGSAGPAVECTSGDITSSHKVRVTAFGTPRV